MRKDREPLPRGFASLWLTVVIDLLGFGIALPLLPLYVKNELGGSAVAVGVVLGAFGRPAGGRWCFGWLRPLRSPAGAGHLADRQRGTCSPAWRRRWR
ncbi:MAG: hypothetical protein R2749_09355 [Acidimicrobiales bacterium]